MQYTEISIELPLEHRDTLEALLSERELEFCESDEGTLDAAPAGRTRFRLYIPTEPPADAEDEFESPDDIVESLRESLPEEVSPTIAVKRRDENEWRDNWKQFFTTRRIGRIAIVPSWEAVEHQAEVGEITLHIDPGRAFGTGGHESTRLCLRMCDQLHDRLCSKSPFPSVQLRPLRALLDTPGAEAVLDVGCGSGVLAIAALKLWRNLHGLGIDIDPEAIEVTQENAERNQVQDRLRSGTMALSTLRRLYPLVFANLTGPTLLSLASPLSARVAPGGVLILSGILDSEATQICDRFKREGFVEVTRATEQEWAALLLSLPITVERGLSPSGLPKKAPGRAEPRRPAKAPRKPGSR